MHHHSPDTASSTITPSHFATAARVLAWCLFITIIFATIVSPTIRPVTGVSHNFEHVLVFLLTGTAFGLGYRRRRLLLYVLAIAMPGILEVSQLVVPGRHARVSDFVVDAFAAFAGMFAASILAPKSIDPFAR